MSLGTRDREAFELLGTRSFDNGYVAALELDMQTRRLTVRLYGNSHGGSATYLASIAFFGVEDLTMGSEDGSFPRSARVATFEVTYDDEADQGRAAIAGTSGWAIGFAYDGIAFEETAATIASLADDD